jgi:8-hydroxy-5-deazaflavin:NADPH oxidoreductase
MSDERWTCLTSCTGRGTGTRTTQKIGTRPSTTPGGRAAWTIANYTGPGGEAQAKVEQLISDVGLRPIRLGDNSQAPVADSVGRLWYTLAHGQNMGRGLTLKVLTR